MNDTLAKRRQVKNVGETGEASIRSETEKRPPLVKEKLPDSQVLWSRHAGVSKDRSRWE